MYKKALKTIIGFFIGSVISVYIFNCSIGSGAISFSILLIGYLCCFYQNIDKNN